jgi:hypothetical protein
VALPAVPPVGQMVPQAPQFCGSMLVLLHRPLQFVSGDWQDIEHL